VRSVSKQSNRQTSKQGNAANKQSSNQSSKQTVPVSKQTTGASVKRQVKDIAAEELLPVSKQTTGAPVKRASTANRPITRQAQKQERREEERQRRQATQRRAVRRKRAIWISGIVAVVVLASAITAYALVNAPKSTKQNPSALPTEAIFSAAYPPIEGVYCDQLEHVDSYHIHVHLTIWINGNPVTVPAQVGIAPDTSCYYWLHTHDTTGVVHIEAPAAASLNLQQFLDIWRKFSTLGYQDQLASSTGWTVWIDGKQISGGFSKVAFQPHMVITIAYNSPNVKPDTVYNFAAGL
jgi:hypothetical protein